MLLPLSTLTSSITFPVSSGIRVALGSFGIWLRGNCCGDTLSMSLV